VANFPMGPLIPIPEPRPIVVIASPIRIHRKRDDRNRECRCVRVERNVSTLILISDVRRIHPAAIAIKGNVAPTPIIEAAHHLDGCVSVELRHLGIRVIRARADAGGFVRDGVFRQSATGY
jgi:hypothetical protein